MFPFQGMPLNTAPGHHMGGGNFVSKLAFPLHCAMGMDSVYKLRLNIDADQYAEHFAAIDECLRESINQTPFCPFEDKPELIVPLIPSYKFYYAVGTAEQPRLHLDRFEGQAQFTLWLPSLLVHDLSCLEDQIQAVTDKLAQRRLERFQAKTDKEIKSAESSIKVFERRINEFNALKTCFMESPVPDVHLLYWQALANWVKHLETTLENQGIAPGGVDNADLPISRFFSLRRTAFTWNFRDNGYVPATDKDTVEQLKKTMAEDPIYHLLLENLDPNYAVEGKQKYRFG